MRESNTPALQHSNTPFSLWPARIGYLLFVLLPVPLLRRELLASRFPGGFVYPPHFRRYSALFHDQEALFVGLIFAVVGLIATRVANRWLRFALFLPFCLWAMWLTVWAFVRSAFMIQLSPWYVLDLVIHPSAIAGVGINPTLFYPEIAGFFAILFATAAAGAW